MHARNRFAGCCICLAALLASSASVAESPPDKLKTQTITIRPVRPGRPIDAAPVRFELIQLPAGTIMLADNDGKPKEHAIKSIWIGKFEVTWDEYDVFWAGLDLSEEEWQRFQWDKQRVRTRTDVPYNPPDAGFGQDGYPASCIHLNAAKKYCAWLSKHTGKRFRLPTEAEWEYACRAGGPPLKPDEKALDKIAWFEKNADDKPHPVGKKLPNAWALYDMLGNVAEYVIRDPKDDKGLIAGGSWISNGADVHSGAREAYDPSWQKHDPTIPPSRDWFDYDRHDKGFRVVMEE